MTLQQLPIIRDAKTGRYIIKYDASAHLDSNCLRKMWYRIFRGIRHGDKDYKMEYGTAFHKAMVVHYSGGTLEQCIDVAFQHYTQPDIFVPDNEWRSSAHLVLCINQYIAHYKKNGDMLSPSLDKEGKPILEKKLSYPYYKTERVEFLLEGTIDFKGKWCSQYDVIADHKTTAITQKESYLNGYTLSPQLMMYKFIHDQLFGGNIACMINGVFLNRSGKNSFHRSELFTFSDEQMDNFKYQLNIKVMQLVKLFETLLDENNIVELNSLFYPNYTCCDEKYGMCEYAMLCRMPSAQDREFLIQNEYNIKTYNPLDFQT